MYLPKEKTSGMWHCLIWHEVPDILYVWHSHILPVLLDPEDDVTKILWHIGNYSPNNRAWYPRRLASPASLWWGPHVSWYIPVDGIRNLAKVFDGHFLVTAFSIREGNHMSFLNFYMLSFCCAIKEKITQCMNILCIPFFWVKHAGKIFMKQQNWKLKVNGKTF
jgi:hypothetical protein